MDGYSLIYIKDGKVVNIIAMDPKDGFESQFADGADSWIYAFEALEKGAKTPPAIGYTFDGVEFYPPVEE